ncbi:MAG: TIGR01777 family oxidoreductase [Chlamydiota bacterium]
MRILISGSSGFIGTSLFAHLKTKGHEVISLVRDEKKGGVFFPFEGKGDASALEKHFDAVIHLCGENIASGRWTKKKKQRLVESRINTTEQLVRAINQLRDPPKHLLVASGLSYFGSRGDAWLTESSLPGEGFLANLCQDWEQAAKGAICPVSYLRFGMVLGPYGKKSALDQMIPLAKKGLSAVLGTGRQYLSWIHIDDAVRAVEWILKKSLEGPVNICSQVPAQQKDFANQLAKSLRRCRFLRIPSSILSLIIGEMAQELLLASTRAMPDKLLKAGFCFKYPELEQALREIISSTKTAAS